MGWIAQVNQLLWGGLLLALLLGIGLYLLVGCRLFPLCAPRLLLKRTLGALRQKTEGVSPYEAMSAALAGTIGTGNIVGVATAIAAGGPGTIFWMWLSGLVCMVIKYAEVTLAVRYREKDSAGGYRGGPMYYIKNGLPKSFQPLAGIFAVCGVLCSFGVGNAAQVGSMSAMLNASFSLPPWAVGLTAALLTALVIFGGIGRIAKFCGYLVPIMSLFYIAGGVFVIGCNHAQLPAAVSAIFTCAFQPEAALSGGAAFGFLAALRFGVARGIFTNEAGMGSAPIAHAAAQTEHPVSQGLWGAFEVLVDTLVVCTLTALAILTSGVVDLETGLPRLAVSAAALTGAAFGSAFGSLGPAFIALSVLLFAWSTILGWSHYGATAAGYLLGPRGVRLYRLIFSALVFAGAVMELGLAWALSDSFNGLMMLPNLIGVLALSGQVARITRNYTARVLQGEPIPPLRSAEDLN